MHIPPTRLPGISFCTSTPIVCCKRLKTDGLLQDSHVLVGWLQWHSRSPASQPARPPDKMVPTSLDYLIERTLRTFQATATRSVPCRLIFPLLLPHLPCQPDLGIQPLRPCLRLGYRRKPPSPTSHSFLQRLRTRDIQSLFQDHRQLRQRTH